MVDISFLYNYKGALYPLNLDATQSPCPTGPGNVKSLVDLCSENISAYSSSLCHAVNVLPKEMYYSLMRAALFLAKDRSIEVLVASWPWKALTLCKFAPKLFDSVGAAYNDMYLSERMRRGVKYTTCLAHTFVECLKKRSPTQLRYLDLTGYPSAEVIVNYLSSHVLLVYNEARQREIISMYNEATRDLPEERRQQYRLDNTLPAGQYFIITLDAFLQTSETHMELCRALKTSRLDECRLKLRLRKLDMTCLGVARISVLLDQLDQQFLEGLCLQYNAINNDGLTVVLPYIEKLQNLSSLDLSCNNINLMSVGSSASALGMTLGALQNLKRLDLSQNRIKTRLPAVLSHIPSSLEYLRLCGCGLSEMDLQYLRVSHHTRTLRELDLSENMLGRIFEQVAPLLQAVATSLVILEMEDCDLEASHFTHLFSFGPELIRLQYMNIARNTQLCRDQIVESAPQLVSMVSLHALKLSYPVECYLSPHCDDGVNEIAKLSFERQLLAHLNSLCERRAHPLIRVKLTA